MLDYGYVEDIMLEILSSHGLNRERINHNDFDIVTKSLNNGIYECKSCFVKCYKDYIPKASQILNTFKDKSTNVFYDGKCLDGHVINVAYKCEVVDGADMIQLIVTLATKHKQHYNISIMDNLL
jgi:hypothetical protein